MNTQTDHPKDADAYNNRGIDYYKKGELDLALQDFNKAIDLTPQSAHVYNNRGAAYAAKGEFDTAIEDYNTAIALNPEFDGAYNSRGIAYGKKGDVNAAIEDFNKAIDLKPDYATAYTNRGIAYGKKGELDLALQDFNKVIDLKPELAEAYLNRGSVYREKREIYKAVQDYSKAIELKPKYATAYNNMGNVYNEIDSLDIAIKNYSKAIELNPKYTTAYYNRGLVWLRLREWEEAKPDLITSKKMGFDIAAAFHNAYESIAAFEAELGVKMPEDIAALLRRDGKGETPLSRVLEKITEIAEKSAEGDYIYRGESGSAPYDKVSSNLYREYEADIEAENFDIAVVQEEILREAREYTTHKMDDLEILTELQHHGVKTNLIDFTEDYLVALFFACDGNHYKPGKVILLKKEAEAYEVVKPPRTIERAGVQKHLFVQSPSGVVEPDAVVDIPADLKRAMLDHLQKHHNISPETIYNDLQGFIENRRTHKSAYTEFYKGLTCHERGRSERDPAEKQAWYDKAIGHYTDAIDLNPDFPVAYNNRGNAYKDKGELDTATQDYNTAIDLNPDFTAAYYNRGLAYHQKGDLDTAIIDFSKAIELKPELATAYYNRGLAYHQKDDLDTAIQDYTKAIDLKTEYTAVYVNRGQVWLYLSEWEKAKADLSAAKDMGFDIVAAFHNAYESVADFEAKHGVKVPEDIAALLSRDGSGMFLCPHPPINETPGV